MGENYKAYLDLAQASLCELLHSVLSCGIYWIHAILVIV